MPRAATQRDALRRLAQLAGVIVVILAAGTAGFALTEDETVWDAFVLSLDTVATVGSVPAPHDTGGEVVKVLLIVVGVGTLFYALVTITELFVAGHLGELLAERRQRRMTASLSDHYIICGYGRVGRQVARDLRAANARYVIIDNDPANRELAEVGVRMITGSSSDEELLREAGIERARAVVACVDSDAENIYIALTARGLRPDIAIVARASQEDAESKLLRAGANRVISPYKASGSEMARLALHPNVSGAREVAAEYRLEEIAVTRGSKGAGRTLGEVRGGSQIVGLRHEDGSFEAQPPAESILGVGDVLIALGTPRTLERLEALFDAAVAPK